MRYIDPNLKEQNIEASSNGGYISDEKYIEEFLISDRGIKSGAYLRPLSYKENLALLICENAVYWGKHGDIKRAIKYLERSVELYPNAAEINDNLGRAYLAYSKQLEGEETRYYAARGNFYQEHAIELGLIRPPKEYSINRMNLITQDEQ